MAELKRTTTSKLFWIDLEMSGLDSRKDLITEIAVVVTDFSFEVLAEYCQGVYQEPSLLQKRLAANPWFRNQPETYQRDIQRISASGLPLDRVESDLLGLADRHFAAQPVVLAGNSVYTDRGFVERYLPALTSRLHYRMLDVSAFKIYMQAHGLEFVKAEKHRALDDIYESIAELKFYLQYFKL